MGLLMGVREVRALGGTDCFVEGDSKVVVSWALGKHEGSWKLMHYICEIRSIIKDYRLSLSYVP